MNPRTLGGEEARDARHQQAYEPHVAPLNMWAQSLRTEVREVPLFDPADSGIHARALLLLESPGPAVSRSGFISMDNPDGTAENMLRLIEESHLDRHDLILWNVVPWQMSRKGVVTPKPTHHAQARPTTRHLLTLLPDLQAVMLVGRHAQRAWTEIGSDLKRFEMPHPSPQNFNTRPEARQVALQALISLRHFLNPGK
ncbi:uracil-DNA glycosylase [Deinococcus sp. A31D244]|uniref:uracil-DNA glycosylase n=1 Tax=Deinococcus sp. A31D244 TaxID=3397675 RepID=UPI0039DF8D14